MVNWWLIGIAIVAILVVSKLIHFRHIKHRVTAIFLIILLLFVFSTAATIIKNHSLNIKTPSGIITTGKLYFIWLGQAFGNLRSLTGSAINMGWMPDSNSSQDNWSNQPSSKTTTNSNWKIP